ncbi:hypothetical protein QE152_g9368 [Popillia japonica]|uniref:Endonuclease/exonuclease/phosphatase domain-containing protein n=1 Tax=Popillia japonica TaxID=7064 RepID=A0AAW1LYH3_POPJA
MRTCRIPWPLIIMNLQNTMASNNYDILALSETWLHDGFPSSMFSIQGYNLYRNDRATRGGGVAFYCKSHIRISISKSLSNDYIEYLWIQLLGYAREASIGVLDHLTGTSV